MNDTVVEERKAKYQQYLEFIDMKHLYEISTD
jgi:hypothetical protein